MGRDSELRFITERMAGPETRNVVVAGPAGVGKTRLAREALEAAKRSGRVTRWAAGTSAAAAIPLGAVAHLLPALGTVSDPLTLLQRAGAAIADQGKGHRLIVGIDDAHLLDELSVTLVHQLALTRAACLVLTVRTGEPAPDPVVTLWKNGLADRLELQQLPRVEMDRLVTGALGGVVDSRTIERLWRATRGNVLFLRELVEGGCETGRLQIRDGVWRWEGRMEPTPRLREIVQAQLGGLGADERTALELLATDEPLGLGRVASLINPEVVAVLERRGLVTVVNSGWRAEVWLAHPIYATVVRDQLPEAEACRLRRRLANTHLPWKRPDDLLRAGTLLLDSDQPGAHASLLADAAVHANALLDHDIAARLARAAIDGSDGRDGVRAHLALLEAVRWQGRPDEAEQVAAVAAPFATSAEDRSRLAVVRALNLFFGLGQDGRSRQRSPAARFWRQKGPLRRRWSGRPAPPGWGWPHGAAPPKRCRPWLPVGMHSNAVRPSRRWHCAG
jgi:AAA ATPase-like protein